MHWIRTAPFRLALGVIAGAVLALLALDLAATYPRSLGRTGADLSLPEVSGDRAPTVSFVETGRAQVPAHRLAQGVGMREREVIVRAAVVEHPQGAFAFGSGLPRAPPTTRPSTSRTPSPHRGASLRDQLGDDVDLWRIVFPTLRWYHLGGATELPDVQTRAGRETAGPRSAGRGRALLRQRSPSPLRTRVALRGPALPRVAREPGRLRRWLGRAARVPRRERRRDRVPRLLPEWPQGLAGRRRVAPRAGRGAARTPWATWSLEQNRFQAAYVIRVLQRAQSSFGVEVVPLLGGALELPLRSAGSSSGPEAPLARPPRRAPRAPAERARSRSRGRRRRRCGVHVHRAEEELIVAGGVRCARVRKAGADARPTSASLQRAAAATRTSGARSSAAPVRPGVYAGRDGADVVRQADPVSSASSSKGTRGRPAGARRGRAALTASSRDQAPAPAEA